MVTLLLFRFRVTNSIDVLLFFHFWVTNVKFINEKSSPSDGDLSYLSLKATSVLVSETFKFKVLKCDFQLPAIMGVQSSISLSSCFYLYATLGSYKYLKGETHLRNFQVNKASSVNKGIVKICQGVDMVRKNWSRIVVAGCGLHYFVIARFGSFWAVANFSTAERFKYFFFTAMKISNHGAYSKEAKHVYF